MTKFNFIKSVPIDLLSVTIPSDRLLLTTISPDNVATSKT
jgi:hypothetical protein